MKRFYITMLLLGCITFGFAQENRKVIFRSVEKNRKTNLKSGYNYMLLDAIKDVDEAYGDFETLVQKVWDKQADANTIPKAASDALAIIETNRSTVAKTPVYSGGSEYQQSVLSYIDVVAQKAKILEVYGMLGADANSDVTEYNNSVEKYNDITTEQYRLRDVMRDKKDYFEKVY